jgi:N-acetylglucosamine-6-phosphate deacetylase
MQTTLRARRLLTATGSIDYPEISIRDGKIASIQPGHLCDDQHTLTPCFFDIHVHGARSFDFMAASVPEITHVGQFLATHGVGAYLPTTVTGPIDTTLHALERLASAIEAAGTESAPTDAARPVAIHLEGPFVSHSKRGVHPIASILAPSIAVFDRFQAAARGHIRLMTIAPELPGALDLIRHANAQGVRISIGHSDATEAEALAGIAAGAVSATHTFNAMRALSHREPGILGVVLDRDDLYAEAICDGIHVHPSMIRLWLKAKGSGRAILITDGMSATGEPDGEYLLGDLAVELRGGTCLLRGTQTLAGSVLTMDRAVENLQRFTGSPLETAIGLATHNPARMLGLDWVADLAPGSPANFNLFNSAGQRTATILHGTIIAS